jgi:2'-5' RNA ligase
MLRLFVALPLPDSVKRSLEPLARGLGDVRWLTPDQQHLTLRFIGEVDNGRLDEVAEALALVQGWPFEVRLEGLGHFPPRGEPRVLWVGIEKNPDLKSLKRRIDRALADVGLPPEARKFAPHVTLARIRGPLSHDRLATYLMRHSLYRSERFPVSDFHLYSSWLKPAGAEHQLEASYELVPGLDQETGPGHDDERA